jgi:hypothetical protein
MTTTNHRDTILMDTSKTLIAYYEEDTVTPPPPPPPVGPQFPIGLDWSKNGAGLILKWKDDNKKQTKEHYVPIVSLSTICAYMKPHGQFETRQYEIIHIDDLPVVVVYLETEPEVLP